LLYKEVAALGDSLAQWILVGSKRTGILESRWTKQRCWSCMGWRQEMTTPVYCCDLLNRTCPAGDFRVEVGDVKAIELKAKALELFRLAAKDGDSNVLFRLLKAHLPGGGLGVKVWHIKAIGLFKEVAALGRGNVDVGSAKVLKLSKRGYLLVCC